MSRKKKLLFWMLLQAFLVSYVAVDYKTVEGSTCIDYTFIYGTISKPQKLFFNNAVMFIYLLSITKSLYLEPMLRIRFQNRLFQQVFKSIAIRSVEYTAYTMLIILEVGIVLGMDVQASCLRGVAVLFLVVVQFSIVYHILYAATRNYTAAAVVEILAYLCISATLILLKFCSVDIEWAYSALENMIPLGIVDVVMLGGIYAILRKTEVV